MAETETRNQNSIDQFTPPIARHTAFLFLLFYFVLCFLILRALRLSRVQACARGQGEALLWKPARTRPGAIANEPTYSVDLSLICVRPLRCYIHSVLIPQRKLSPSEADRCSLAVFVVVSTLDTAIIAMLATT